MSTVLSIIFSIVKHNITYMSYNILVAGCECGPAERRLINDLMSFYQKLERPVVSRYLDISTLSTQSKLFTLLHTLSTCLHYHYLQVNESDAIQLKFGLTLQQIMNVVRHRAR